MEETKDFVLDQVYDQGFCGGISWNIDRFEEIINHVVKKITFNNGKKKADI